MPLNRLWSLFYAVCVLLAWRVFLTRGEFVDMTLNEKQSGVEVVETVTTFIRETCIIDDHLFLRRMAAIETLNGLDPLTYRTGYNGGIWNVDERMFSETQNSTMKYFHDRIRQNLNIDWTRVTWADLRKPLYSGLAAALYIIKQTNNEIPIQLENQANIWSKIGSSRSAHDFYLVGSNVTKGCNLDKLLDVVIALDFAHIDPFDLIRLQFVLRDVLTGFQKDQEHTRVGIVSRRGAANATWYLNSQIPGYDVTHLLNALKYIPGSTGAEEILKFTNDIMFTFEKGMRSGSSKAVVLITDGQLTNLTKADAEATRLRAKGISLLIVSVGNKFDTRTFRQLASQPICSNFKHVNDFVELDALASEVQDALCRVPAILSDGTYSYPCSRTVHLLIGDTSKGQSVKVTSTTEEMTIYTSFVYQTPDNIFHDIKFTSDPTGNQVLFLRGSDNLYVTVQGNKSCTGNFTVELRSGYIFNNSSGKCLVGRTVRDCTSSEMNLILKDTLLIPDRKSTNICGGPAPQPRFYPNVNDNTTFLICDRKGDLYLGLCPLNSRCVLFSTECKNTNPCTSELIMSGVQFHQEQCGDPSTYIRCSQYGVAEVKPCTRDLVWDQVSRRCIFRFIHSVLSGTDNKNITNPCTHAQGEHIYYPYPSDPSKYIFCDGNGNGFENNCPPQMLWNQMIKSCVNPEPLMIGR
ncbi:hypothetical protein ACJMK2_039126 [Sinanodonta woodiana]|uniref:Uncharacterized protein n=1 Tax=Sinanodonta woodiana TaxID=1069815 RepID=A0ABD3WB75_SINWO